GSAKASRLEAVETVVANARAQPQMIARASLLSEALKALRDVGASAERIEELRRELDEAQRASLSEMRVVSMPIDLTEMAEQAERDARGKPFKEALVRLVHQFQIPNVGDLRREVEDLIDRYPLRMTITGRQVDERGRVTGIRPGILSDRDQREEAVVAEMRDAAKRYWMTAALGVIEPYRKALLLEHAPALDDFVRLVRDRPFVPGPRIELFARGLMAGFY